MNETELTAALKSLKEETESRATILMAKVAQAQGFAERYQKKLGQLYEESEQKAADLTRSYLSIPAPAPSTDGNTPPDGVRRTRRWSLDEPVLKMIRAMKTAIIGTPEVWARWNQEHPGRPVGRSTIRGVLERLERDHELVPVQDGGRGRTNVRSYRVPEVIDVVMDQQRED